MRPTRNTRRERSGAERLRNVRSLRAGRSSPVTLAVAIGAHIDDVSRRHRALGAIGERWGALVPGGLAGRAWPESFRRGVLTVRAADSAAGFEFDRWLRAGGEGVLRGAGVSRVRVSPG